MYSDLQVYQAHLWFNSDRAITQRSVVAADKVAAKQRVSNAKRIAMMIVRGTAPHKHDATGMRLMSVDGFMSMMNAPSRR